MLHSVCGHAEEGAASNAATVGRRSIKHVIDRDESRLGSSAVIGTFAKVPEYMLVRAGCRKCKDDAVTKDPASLCRAVETIAHGDQRRCGFKTAALGIAEIVQDRLLAGGRDLKYSAAVIISALPFACRSVENAADVDESGHRICAVMVSGRSAKIVKYPLFAVGCHTENDAFSPAGSAV